MNRRTLLKYAGTGMVAGVISGSVGKIMATSLTGDSSIGKGFTGKIPFSLIIDDESPA